MEAMEAMKAGSDGGGRVVVFYLTFYFFFSTDF